jgi:putative sigma-54 modulation protein
MNVEYVARNFELRDEIRDYTERKLAKIKRFAEEPVEIRVILEQEKHRHIAEITLSHRHGTIQATEQTEQMTDAINLAVDKVEKQARRSRKKYMDQRRKRDRQVVEEPHWPVEVLEAETLRAGSGRRVIKRSALPIKPMSVEEAALQLEGSSNDFVVFKDATSDQVSVLYKRRDANYGLISPEL